MMRQFFHSAQSSLVLFLLAFVLTATSYAAEDFLACLQFFANGKPPVVTPRPTNRALCYDAFAILHSGESKTAIFVAEKLNRESIADAHEKRADKFFADARLRAAERATLEDYKGSGYDRGHMAPAGDMPTPQAMEQSFSLANIVPQAPEHNRGVWAKSVERWRPVNMQLGLRETYLLLLAQYLTPASPKVQALALVK